GTAYTVTFDVTSAFAPLAAFSITILRTPTSTLLPYTTLFRSETDAAADISTSGTLTISDVDSPATFVAQAATAGGYGTFAIDAADRRSTRLNSSHSQISDGVSYSNNNDVTSADGTHTAVTIHI